jgi:hypothetical protein
MKKIEGLQHPPPRFFIEIAPLIMIYIQGLSQKKWVSFFLKNVLIHFVQFNILLYNLLPHRYICMCNVYVCVFIYNILFKILVCMMIINDNRFIIKKRQVYIENKYLSFVVLNFTQNTSDKTINHILRLVLVSLGRFNLY